MTKIPYPLTTISHLIVDNELTTQEIEHLIVILELKKEVA